MLKGKKILLGISGSIAAYKSALLTRLLVKQGAEVKIVMTDSAKEFITPLTLATLSKNPVLSDFVRDKTGTWNNHVDLGLWADLILIAPATANTMAKMAHGICDNLLLATYLSARCPVFVAPAMDLDMYAHEATQSNTSTLQSYGNKIIDAEFGELASGLIGSGRMAEPEHIMAVVTAHFQQASLLSGKKVLVNAGPTFEAIDPVRFIGNHSSGKMGYAIAEKVAALGAKVELVSGPSNLSVKHENISITKVTSAEEMYQACSKFFPEADIGVLAAAVADYTPKTKESKKIKKKSEGLQIELIKTKDIASELGGSKSENQFLVGFALETDNERDNAQKKLESKNFDMIVLNSLNDIGAGFEHDTNKVSILHKDNNLKEFELKNKAEVANDIVNEILSKISN